MEFELALNTIFYIMIFLFPGILFRKFRFIGHDFKQFDRGNLFERFLITIFISIIILVISFLIFGFIKNVLGISLLESVSYGTFKSIFDSLSGNQLPNEDKLNQNYIDYGILLSAIYVLSFLLGILIYFISNSAVVRSLGIFKRHNYWHDLIMRDMKKENKLSKKFVLGYTLADVLIEMNEKTKLYSGRVENYYLCSTGELETLVLSRVKRYKYTKDDSKNIRLKALLNENNSYKYNKVNDVQIKEVPGQAFIIDKKRIVNINLSYIYVEKENKQLYKNLATFADIISIILIIFNFLSPFTSFIDEYADSVLMKILFVISGLFIIGLLNDLFNQMIYGKLSEIETFKNILGIVFFMSIAIIALGLIKLGLLILFINIVLFILVAIIMDSNSKKNDANS